MISKAAHKLRTSEYKDWRLERIKLRKCSNGNKTVSSDKRSNKEKFSKKIAERTLNQMKKDISERIIWF